MSSNSDSQNKDHSYGNDNNSSSDESSDPSFDSAIPQPTNIMATQWSHTLNPSTFEISDGKVFLDHHMHPEGYTLLITWKWFSFANFPSELRTWPKKTDDYVRWLNRVAAAKNLDRKTWGIFDLIRLSSQHIPLRLDLLFAFAGF